DPFGQDAVSTLERRDDAPLAYVANPGPFGGLVELLSTRTMSGPGGAVRPHSAGEGSSLAHHARAVALLRARLGFIQELHVACSGWFSFGTTAPPPFQSDGD